MNLKEKLMSRKLWVAVFGAAAGIAIAFGAPESIVTTILGVAMSLTSVVFYIYTEGKSDAAAVDLSADFVKKLLDAIEALEKKQEK